MRLRHYVRRKSTLKKILATVIGILIAFGGVITGNCYDRTNDNHQNNVVMSQREVEGLKINNSMRRSSSIKITGKRMVVGATAYCNDPITATGTKPTVGRTIAVDPRIIPYGTRVYIPKFDKVFIAEDCGSAIKGKRIDIYMNTYDECMKWGFRDIEIYILDK